MTERFKQDAESLEELRAIIRRADKLGFSPVGYMASGDWETNHGEPVFISGETIEVDKIGHKYLYAEIDGSSTPLVFGPGNDHREAAKIRVTLEGER